MSSNNKKRNSRNYRGTILIAILILLVTTVSISLAESATLIESVSTADYSRDEYVILFPPAPDKDASKIQLTEHFTNCKIAFRKVWEDNGRSNELVEYLFVINGAIIHCDQELLRNLSESSAVDKICSSFQVFPPKVKTIMPSKTEEANDEKYAYGVKLINAPKVWNDLGIKGTNVFIGHIDTGVNAEHPDLQGKIHRFKDFVVTSNTSPNDNGGHGTHTAGTICGGATSGKAIGVAPEAKLIVAKAIGYGKSSANLLKAMNWMCDPDEDPETNDVPAAVSCSWRSGGGDQTPFYRAVDTWVSLGIFPCFSAGNSGSGASTITPPKEYPPAFCSAAVDVNDEVTSFSSRGPGKFNGMNTDKPDVAAPGDKVYSSDRNGGYSFKSGTSMACPHTAGVIALMTQANRLLSVEEKMQALKNSSIDLGTPGFDYTYGHGRISALEAVQKCLSKVVLRGSLYSSNDNCPVTSTTALTRTISSTVTNEEKLPVTTNNDGKSSAGHGESLKTDVPFARDINLPVSLSPLPSILLIDDDGGLNCDKDFEQALHSFGTSFDYYNHTAGELNLQKIAFYDTLIWVTGSVKQDKLNSNDMTVLTEYLKTGGNLLISGDNMQTSGTVELLDPTIGLLCKYHDNSVAEEETRRCVIKETLALFPSGNENILRRLVLMPQELKKDYFTYVAEVRMTPEELREAAGKTGARSLLRVLRVISNYRTIE
jgi:hypothetical protein